MILVWYNEWQTLQQWYTSEDKQVCLLKLEAQDGVQYTSSPGEPHDEMVVSEGHDVILRVLL